MKIGGEKDGPFWIENVLPGIDLRFRPIEPRDCRAARRASAAAVEAASDVDDLEKLEIAGDAFSLALIRRGLLDWRGVGNLDGEPIEPTADAAQLDDAGNPVLDDDGEPVMVLGTVSRFLSDAIVFEACDNAYVMPFVQRDREGNGFAGSPPGTSTRAMPAPAIVTSAAKPEADAAARNAPTGNTSSKRKRGTKSGRSSKQAAGS